MLDRRAAAILLAAFVWASAVAAQQPTRETQIPLDPDRGVLEIGPELRRELGLLPEQQGFEVARLFRADDGTMVLEISRAEGGRLVRERRPMSEAALAAFRSDLGARFAARGQTRAVDRAGRSGLVLTETLMGVGLYGWMIPRGLDIDSDRGQVAAYLLTAGASFYVPYRVTRNASVSIVERNAALWGSTRGALHGFFLGRALQGDESYNDSYEDQQRKDRILAFSVIGTSIAETIGTYQIVQGGRLNEGQAAFYGAAGDIGIPAGLGLAYVLGLFNENVESCQFDYCSIDEYGGTVQGYAGALAFSLASPWLASLTNQADHYTQGDARVLRSFALLGAHVALAPAWFAFQDTDRENDKATVASMLAGGAAGTLIGNAVLKNRSLSGGDGLLVMAGHLAGGLGALGVTYLFDGGARASDGVYIATSAAGSAAGMLLTLQAVSGGSRVPDPDNRAGIDVDVTPIPGLVSILSQRNAKSPVRAPLLTIRF